jgi:hypothetical protein
VVTVIAVAGIAAGIVFVILVGIVVGIVDAVNASSWKQVAEERRMRWEAQLSEDGRKPEYHGSAVESWDED